MTNSIASTSAVTVAAGATVDLGGFSDVIGSLAGAGTVTSSVAGAVTLTAGGNNATTAFSGLIQNGFDVAETEVSLLLYGCGHMVLRRDAELARAHQDAAARRDFHAVAIAGKRRPNAGWGDMFHRACILTGIRGR